MDNKRKPFYKKVTFWVVLVVVLLLVAVAAGGGSDTKVEKKDDGKVTLNLPTRFDPETVYDKVVTGQSKADAEKVIGVKAENCTTSETAGQKLDICTYGSFTDKGRLTVTYSNDKVFSKTK